ncbi:MAG: DNA polymerase III subunit beta, partial [Bacteroidaceae bacterium]|nr:DNA polymerase III subunit beta [Bacteroidaceae bacterium]
KKPATFLKNFLSKEQGDAVIRFSQRNAVITTENYVMNCRLIEGKYPRYESVIPQDNPNCVTVSRTAMLSTLRRVLIFSNASSSLIKLQLGMGNMTISSQDIDFSMSAEETLLCEYNGTPLSIGFNGTFLTEVLNYAEADEVVIKMADASRACIIVPATKMENEDLLMLIMPMLLGEYKISDTIYIIKDTTSVI